jgi:hypothetical protein
MECRLRTWAAGALLGIEIVLVESHVLATPLLSIQDSYLARSAFVSHQATTVTDVQMLVEAVPNQRQHTIMFDVPVNRSEFP